MKAIVCTRYGPPEGLQIREVEKPQPKDNEILIKVRATTAHIGDTKIRRAKPAIVRLFFGLFKPKKNLILGIEASGVVEAVGANVKTFKRGDEVFALTGFGFGGYGEYVCLPEKVKEGKQEWKGLVEQKPENLSFEEAAAVPSAGLTALKNLQKGKLGAGQKILINGASGSLGTYAIQLAKHFGAEVTAVCSAGNFDLVRSLGAEKVIDYTTEDFTACGEKFDVVYDAVMKSSRSKCKKLLVPGGVFTNNYRVPKIVSGDLAFLKSLVEDGVLKPVMDRTWAMDDIVEAHRYVDTERKKGNVAVIISSD